MDFFKLLKGIIKRGHQLLPSESMCYYSITHASILKEVGFLITIPQKKRLKKK